MDHEAVEEIEAEQRETRAELLKLARDDPDLLEEIERFQEFMQFADSNPGILREAQEFVDATSE